MFRIFHFLKQVSTELVFMRLPYWAKNYPPVFEALDFSLRRFHLADLPTHFFREEADRSSDCTAPISYFIKKKRLLKLNPSRGARKYPSLFPGPSRGLGAAAPRYFGLYFVCTRVFADNFLGSRFGWNKLCFIYISHLIFSSYNDFNFKKIRK